MTQGAIVIAGATGLVGRQAVAHALAAGRDVIALARPQSAPAFRAALVLREIEGLSYDEIAQILEVSLGTVKSKILRGREALKEALMARLKPAAGKMNGWRMKEMIAE
mgnify:CR=1 FL=1